MRARHKLAYITECFVGCDQPAALGLDARPQLVVDQPCPSLGADSYRFIPGSYEDLGNLLGKVLIDFDQGRHGLLPQGQKEVFPYRLGGVFKRRLEVLWGEGRICAEQDLRSVTVGNASYNNAYWDSGSFYAGLTPVAFGIDHDPVHPFPALHANYTFRESTQLLCGDCVLLSSFKH